MIARMSPRIEYGTAQVDCRDAGGTFPFHGEGHVDFARPFSEAPSVQVSAMGNADFCNASIRAVTAAGFDFSAARGTAGTRTVHWLAVGW